MHLDVKSMWTVLKPIRYIEYDVIYDDLWHSRVQGGAPVRSLSWSISTITRVDE